MKLGIYLERAKLTQAEFAAVSGLSQGHISRLLRGLTCPDFGTMLTVHRASMGNVLPGARDWPRHSKRRRAPA